MLYPLLVLLSFFQTGDCGTYQEYQKAFLESWLGHIPVTANFPGSLQAAETLRDCWLEALGDQLGEPVGYKAAFTSEAARKRFGLEKPLLGILLKGMLLEGPAVVPPDFASVPLIEADLLVRVGNESINQATSAEEAMGAIDAVLPFIELPDMVFSRDLPLNQELLTLSNAGARLGVYGRVIPWKAEDYQELGTIKVQLLGPEQEVLAEGSTRALMGHPALALLWIRDAVLLRGGKLKKGDLLSLGSVTMPMPIKVSGQVTARYYGLGGQDVEVTLELARKP